MTKFLIAFGFQFGTFRFVRIVREFGFGQVAFVVVETKSIRFRFDFADRPN